MSFNPGRPETLPFSEAFVVYFRLSMEPIHERQDRDITFRRGPRTHGSGLHRSLFFNLFWLYSRSRSMFLILLPADIIRPHGRRLAQTNLVAIPRTCVPLCHSVIGVTAHNNPAESQKRAPSLLARTFPANVLVSLDPGND